MLDLRTRPSFDDGSHNPPSPSKRLQPNRRLQPARQQALRRWLTEPPDRIRNTVFKNQDPETTVLRLRGRASTAVLAIKGGRVTAGMIGILLGKIQGIAI